MEKCKINGKMTCCFFRQKNGTFNSYLTEKNKPRLHIPEQGSRRVGRTHLTPLRRLKVVVLFENFDSQIQDVGHRMLTRWD